MPELRATIDPIGNQHILRIEMIKQRGQLCGYDYVRGRGSMTDKRRQQLDGLWMQAQFRLIDKYQGTSIQRLKKESGERDEAQASVGHLRSIEVLV